MLKYICLMTTALLIACGGGQTPATSAPAGGSNSPDGNAAAGAPPAGGQDDFGLQAGDASAPTASKLKATANRAVLKLIVRNDSGEPIEKVVVKIESEDGYKTYTAESDANGYTEALVPTGRQYTLSYLALFEDKIEKKTFVPGEEFVTMKLTLNYIAPKPRPMEVPDEGTLVDIPEEAGKGPALILEGVVFDTAKATLKPESFPHLENVIEYMTYKPSAIIEISGHTDNRGNYEKNMKLSEDRALAVREYLATKGIDETRIMAIGYGPDRPIADNETETGRQLNRRVEARDIEEL